MTLRRWLGLVMLVALVIVTSGKLVSTAANQVPKSNAGEEKVRVHIPIPAETTPQDSTAVDTGDTTGSDGEDSTGGDDPTDTTDSANGDETATGDQQMDQSSETSDAGQPATADGAGAPAAQGAVAIPRPTATASSVPTVIPTPTPAPVVPTATSTPAPPVPGNVQSAGVPPGPTSGISWSVESCSSSSAATGWELVPSAQVGVLTAAITNGQAGAVLDCVAYVANTGTTPIAITGVVADFDPAVFALDTGLDATVTLQPCGVPLPFGSRPDGVPENCWTVVPLTIRIGAAVGQDWISIGVASGSAD